MADVKEEENQDYMKTLEDLLSHYEDGWDIFKKAPDWDYPVQKKEEFADDNSIPDTWIGLAVLVHEIIAREKYGLDMFDNTIQVVNDKQLLDALVTGMPVHYDHWSFGKRLLGQEYAYNAGQMGKIFEIIFNTDPALAYFVDSNSKTTQLLVSAHACVGHNSFAKGNYVMQDNTKPGQTLGDFSRFKKYIHDLEDKFGIDRVEKVLDAAHALESHGIDIFKPYKKKKHRKPEEIKARKKKIAEMTRESRDIEREASNIPVSKTEFGKAAKGKKPVTKGHENVLRYIAEKAPHLSKWERDILLHKCEERQYFIPIALCQVMNEGWASFWHHRIMTDMEELDLIDEGMYLEFQELHTAVAENQPDLGQMNPYTLGFEMWTDIKRICMDPTEEDFECHPDIAGNGDWVSTFREIMADFEDENFIRQYLSPKMIREFKFINVHDEGADSPFLEVTQIHNDEGYDEIREKLAQQYSLGESHVGMFDRPDIRVAGHDKKTFELTLHHYEQNGKPLDMQDMREVLAHAHRLWGYPITLKTVNAQMEVTNTVTFPKESAPGRAARPSP